MTKMEKPQLQKFKEAFKMTNHVNRCVFNAFAYLHSCTMQRYYVCRFVIQLKSTNEGTHRGAATQCVTQDLRNGYREVTSLT